MVPPGALRVTWEAMPNTRRRFLAFVLSPPFQPQLSLVGHVIVDVEIVNCRGFRARSRTLSQRPLEILLGLPDGIVDDARNCP